MGVVDDVAGEMVEVDVSDGGCLWKRSSTPLVPESFLVFAGVAPACSFQAEK